MNEALIERLAQHLCDEYDEEFDPVDGAEWPEHENDDGHRGDRGHVRIQPSDVQARARESAERIAALFDQHTIQSHKAYEAEITSLREALKPFTRRAPVQGFSAGISWEMHLRAYDAYCKKWGAQQALIEGGCRGGFGQSELDGLIPGWREEVAEEFRRAQALAIDKASTGASSSTDHLQQAGRAADIVAEAIGSYREWILDDDYDVSAALHRIMGRMIDRLEMGESSGVPIGRAG